MSRFHELITGFHGFRNEYLLKDKEFFEQLAHGQSPKTLVIACCDSRTDPAIILGCKPGDLFVVRSIAAKGFRRQTRCGDRRHRVRHQAS